MSTFSQQPSQVPISHKKNEKKQCKCKKAFLNYFDSKLKLTFMANALFPDGSSTFIKSETTWNVPQEEHLSLELNLSKNEISSSGNFLMLRSE